MPNRPLGIIVDDYAPSLTHDELLRAMHRALEHLDRPPLHFQPPTPYTSLPSRWYVRDTPVASTMKEDFQVGDLVERVEDLSSSFWLERKPRGNGPYKIIEVVGDGYNSIILEGGYNGAKFTGSCFRKVGGRKTSRKLSGFGRFNKSLNEKGL